MQRVAQICQRQLSYLSFIKPLLPVSLLFITICTFYNDSVSSVYLIIIFICDFVDLGTELGFQRVCSNQSNQSRTRYLIIICSFD